ncbi:39S ribosomal protein L42, mitochondrial-like [Lytechinus variegatus]|uniref:39S ribosomal protein L42, mitochondrial-like n=1 Tax=Lytechinus variegatus TaxID=7654 RepID=UPI001BB1557D|nr:39S ribosomal protein L42, mitochondrial-like [Lytechinus variegatus]
MMAAVRLTSNNFVSRFRSTFCSIFLAEQQRKYTEITPTGTWSRWKSTKIKRPSEPIIVESENKDMIICYHPAESFPYEHTKPIPRPDPSRPEESAEGMLRVKFKSKSWDKERQGPSIEELSDMFYTTKHRWYPLGIRRRNLAKVKPPKDRPIF